ncbi:hypothetical protein GCM10027449_26140 [Sinomonas notoginsengisoli]|uniref:DUF6541 family protein n=1 Tax=Sinomonas notoginsengisoli TaxID=1457311 RepID=UPI001F1F0805|nr:DUF6541 family protein [Sinomonas notoginsengisoli]
MTWMQTIPTFAAALAVMFAPGLAILAAGGVRRLNLAALSAPVSTTLSGCIAVVAPFLGQPFTPVLYFGTAAVVCLLVVAIRLVLRVRTEGLHPTAELACNGPLAHQDLGRMTAVLAAPAGIAVAALVIGYRYMSGFGSPENFSQTFDNIYHLNAVRHIADTLNGSSLTLGNLTPDSQAFYPAAMHDSMAVVAQLTGESIPVVVNVVTIATGALVWPASCLFLISRIVGYRPVPLMAAGVLSAGFSAFPYLMVAFGVLYPNHAAIALLPAVLGLGIEAVGMAVNRGNSFGAPIIMIAATLPGLALTHPSTAIAFLAFLAPVVLGKADRSWKEYRDRISTRKISWWWTGFAIFYLMALTIVWIKVRPSLGAAPWTPFQSNARALGEIVSAAPMGTTASWVLLPLTIIGLYVLARRLRRMWSILGVYLVGALLYMVVSSWSPGAFRTFLAGVWYNDSFRLAALLPVTTLPVVVLGAEWLAWRVRAATEWLIRSFAMRATRTGAKNLTTVSGIAPITSAVSVWVLIAVLATMGQGGTLSIVQKRISTIWALTSASDLVDSDELALIDRIPALVPSTDTIVANPYMGGSLVYALADRSTVAPHVFGNRTPDEETVLDHWDEAAYNTAVCPAIKRLKAYWALDFGTQTVIPMPDPYVGLNDLTSGLAPRVTLVADQGHARLFHVTCP